MCISNSSISFVLVFSMLENAPRHVAWFGVKKQFHTFFDYRCFQWVRLLWKFSMKIRQLLERYIIYASFHLPFRFCKQISKLCKTRLNGKRMDIQDKYHGSNTLQVVRNCCRIGEKKTQIRFDIELIEVIGCEYFWPKTCERAGHEKGKVQANSGTRSRSIIQVGTIRHPTRSSQCCWSHIAPSWLSIEDTGGS